MDLLQLFISVASLLTTSLASDWVDVCTGTRGRIRILNKSNNDDNNNNYDDSNESVVIMRSAQSVFVRSQSASYTLLCEAFVSESDYYSKLTLNLAQSKSHVSSRSQQYVQTSLKESSLAFRNAVNRENETVTCMHDRDLICSVDVVIVARDDHKCVANKSHSNDYGEMRCDVELWLDQMRPTRLNFDLGLRSGFNQVFSKRAQPNYAYFDEQTRSFIDCHVVNEDNNGKNETKTSKQSISCPIKKELTSDKPVLIRIETRRNTAVTAVNPSGFVSDLAFFLVDLEQVVRVEDIVETDDKEQDIIVFVVISVFVVLSMVVIGLVLIGITFSLRLRHKSRHPINNVFNFEEDHLNKNVKNQAEDLAENEGKEQSSLTYDKLLTSSDCSTCSEPLSSSSFASNPQLSSLLSRQLTADSELRLSPDLTLNQQVSALSYDTSLEVQRQRFKLNQLIGAGHFGAVYKGHLDENQLVAIKTSNDALDMTHLSALISELKILANLGPGHENLVNLIGACTSRLECGQLWLIMELCCNGDLKSFLVKHRADFNKANQPIYNTRLLLQWALGIAEGMSYLSGRRIMHGDLAARNVLLNVDLKPKISDFGLSKHFYKNVNYRKQQRIDVPYKWMALEFLNDGCFVLQSDVWSYGIVLWEMFTLGKEPYETIDSIEGLLASLRNGERLILPHKSPICRREAIRVAEQRVMKRAWMEQVELRIDFKAIVEEITTIMDRFDDKESRTGDDGYVEMRTGVNVGNDNNSYLTLATVKRLENDGRLVIVAENDNNEEYIHMSAINVV